MTEHQPKTHLLMVDFERTRQILLASQMHEAEAQAKEQGKPYDEHADRRQMHERAFVSAAQPGTIFEMFESACAQHEERGLELHSVTYGHDGKFPVFIGLFKLPQEQRRILTMGGV